MDFLKITEKTELKLKKELQLLKVKDHQQLKESANLKSSGFNRTTEGLIANCI